MKRIIICLIVFSISYCSYDSCVGESDQTKCENHQIDEYKGFSCYKFSNEDNEAEKSCFPFPDDSNSQKSYVNIFNGMGKELYSYDPKYESGIYDFSEEEFFTLKKESYSKGEEIKYEGETFSEEDKKIITQQKNTCLYFYYGKYFDELYELSNDLSKYKAYENIQDKNICFNANQFSELKDLVDCGYAEIKYVIENKEYNIKTCFLIPGNNMPEDLESFFKKEYIDILFEEVSISSDLFYNIELYEQTKNQAQDNSRRLSSSSTRYEAVVENKNGKKVKYTDSSNSIEIIANDAEESNSNKNTKNSNSNKLKFNILLFIFTLLLLNF